MITFKQYLTEIQKINKKAWKGDSTDISQAISSVLSSKIWELYNTALALPGGSALKYNTIKDHSGDLHIFIFDDEAKVIHPKEPRYRFKSEKFVERGAPIVGHLKLMESFRVNKAWVTKVVSVVPSHRGKRIGLALYGIVLDVLGLTLASDFQQTKDGIKMWAALKSVPGVRVYALTSGDIDEKDLPKGSGPYVDDKRYVAIPVKVQNGKLSTGDKGIKVYGNNSDVRLIAKKVQ